MTSEKHKITTALLMAAGMGTRIRPLSENIPKPLIQVNGIPMIESLLNAITKAGITEIIISVGYKKEEYLYLQEKYSGITFVENKEYTKKNTISSFYAAKDMLKNKNCLVCESDLYIANSSIFTNMLDKSRYYLKYTKPQNYEWGFEIDNNKVKKVVRPKSDVYLNHHMYGLAYWLKNDMNTLINAVEKAYLLPGHEQKAYDEIGNDIFSEIDMGLIEVKNGDLYEIDCIEDLVKIDMSYQKYL